MGVLTSAFVRDDEGRLGLGKAFAACAGAVREEIGCTKRSIGHHFNQNNLNDKGIAAFLAVCLPVSAFAAAVVDGSARASVILREHHQQLQGAAPRPPV